MTRTPRFHCRAHTVLCAAALLSGAGCDRARPDGAEMGAAAIRNAPPAAEASSFSGRVPRLGDADRPRDTLRMHREIGDTSHFASPVAVQAVGGSLVVADRFADPHLGVYDLRSGRLVRRLGRDGKGPNEIQDAAWFVPVRGATDRVWVYDFGARRFVLLRLNDAARPVERLVSLASAGAIESPVWVDGRIVSNGLFPAHTLQVMDGEGKPLDRLSAAPPFTPRDANPAGLRQLNRSLLATDPGARRVALAYQWKSRIDFLTTRGERIGSVAGPRRTTPAFRVEGERFFWGPDERNQMAYWVADATERHVYALFCGCTGSTMPSRLHVFRWNGDFVAEIALDREVSSLDVSSDDRRLFATFTEPSPGVGEWLLPPWLHDAGARR